MGNWGLIGSAESATGAAGLTGAGADVAGGGGGGGGAIVCGGRGGGVLQAVSHKATMHEVQAKCEDFRKWTLA